MADLQEANDALARLVGATYDATVDPLRYEALLQCWDAFLRCRAEQAHAAVDDLLTRFARGEDPEAAAVTAHFARAMELFERLGRARRMEAEAQAVADSLPTIGLVLDAQGRLVALNAGARTLIAEEALARPAPPRLEELALDETAKARVGTWIRGRAGAATPFLLAPCQLGASETRSCLIVTPVAVAKAKDAAANGPFFLATTLDLHLDSDVIDAFVNAFALSSAEGAVAAALASGARPAEIAERRGASLNTIRTQIKSATKKMGADGAGDVVRMFCGFAASFTAARAVGENASRRLPAHGLRRTGAVTLSSGRRLSYVEQGAPDGRPALFLHSLCFGPSWPDRAIEAAARKRWRIIGPLRPGFGDTDPALAADEESRIATSVADMIRLLDRLEIERTLIVSHQTASTYAIRLALAAPERVAGLLALSHLPIWRDEMIAELPPRIGLLARTGRYAPNVLPFLARAAMAMVDAGDHERLARIFFHGADHDLRSARRPEVLAPIAEGLIDCVRQGPFAFCREVEIALRNFEAALARVSAPIRVLHGALDAAMPPHFLIGAERLAPRLETTLVEGAGGTLLYTHWPVVLDYMERLRAETGA